LYQFCRLNGSSEEYEEEETEIVINNNTRNTTAQSEKKMTIFERPFMTKKERTKMEKERSKLIPEEQNQVSRFQTPENVSNSTI
jgi:hypothetical protein